LIGDKEKPEAFFQRRVPMRREKHGFYQQGRLLHSALLRATFDTPTVDVPRRRVSISLDGTPLVYSLKMTRKSQYPDFRMLVEPGGLGITVPQQIDGSLRTVDLLLGSLGWEKAVEPLNAVITRVFPDDPGVVSHWWGGMWLGMSLSVDRVELRLYFNLRHGEALARWQRAADVLTWFSDTTLTTPLKTLIEQVSPHAIPVGLGVVVSDSVRGFRIYTGMHKAGYDSILASCPNNLIGSGDALETFCTAFTRAFGPFAPQSVTLGYDFQIGKDGHLRPNVTRAKVDVCCESSGKPGPLVVSLLNEFLETYGVDPDQFRVFAKDLEACFGTSNIQYISLGFNDGLDHLTTYVKPGGYEQT
jgi:hypothetical protein